MPSANISNQFRKQTIIIITAGILTSLMLLWLGWSIFSTFQTRTLKQNQNYETQLLYQKIIYLDEVLTMSAHMAAATGDESWELRYKQSESLLDAAIMESKSLAALTGIARLPEHIGAANQKLMKMEHQVLELAKQGRLIDAQQLLFSNEYEKQKQLYRIGALSFAKSSNKVSRLRRLQGVIQHLDEILTMSTHMAISTGDPRWEQRYRQFETQLEAAIIEADILTANSKSYSGTDQTNAANKVLVELENKAFTLVRKAHLAEAQAVLSSEQYKENKQIYANGLIDLNSALVQIASSQAKTEKQYAFGQIIVIAVFILSLIVIWLFILWTTQRWQTVLLYKNSELNARSRALANLNETLEVKVEERTAEIQAAQETLKIQALRDALTGLPNRYALNKFLEQEISRSVRHNYFNAVLFLDLDDFKSINDVLGHEAGDSVLKIVTERLNLCRRKEDFVGRLGGDESVLVLTELGDDLQISAKLAYAMSQQIIRTLDEPIRLSEHNLIASSCIGIALFPSPQASTAEELLKQADIALYHAKSKGRGVASFFNEEMQKQAEKRLNLARELQEAIDLKQLSLHYQPQVNDDGQLFGLEALVRWNHPTRGIVGPNEFIPIAEEAGLISRIGRYVLHHSLAELSAYFADNEPDDHMKVAVNISPSHFLEVDFVDQIAQVLNAYDLQCIYLVLEITEGVVIKDIEDILIKMEALRALGVGISLDDFGTGYSSLAYLKRLPLDTLKIDRSFIHDIDVDANSAAIAKAILTMSASLEIDVIAEGVETETQTQTQLLRQWGCRQYQGYFFSRPAPLNSLIEQGIFKQDASESRSSGYKNGTSKSPFLLRNT